jgi:hypothetical protein
MERLKPGRKPMENKDKVKMVGAYLRPNEKEAINKTYGSLTNAVRKLILSQIKVN